MISPVKGRVNSSRKLLAALGATRGQHKTPTFGGHTGAKAVAACAYKVRRLKRALHSGTPSDVARNPSKIRAPYLFEARSLGAGQGEVNSPQHRNLQHFVGAQMFSGRFRCAGLQQGQFLGNLVTKDQAAVKTLSPGPQLAQL